MMPLEEAIVETLRRSGPCCLDDIITYLPNLSWGEIFLAVDRMSRDGWVLLRQLGYSTYQIALRSPVCVILRNPAHHRARRSRSHGYMSILA